MGQGLDEAFLNGVEGVGFMAQESIGDPIRRQAIAAKEFFQNFLLPCREASEQLLIA
jgi:hypothetical protein